MMSFNSTVKVHKVRNIIIQWSIVVLAWYFLYHQLIAKEGLDKIVEAFRGFFPVDKLLYLFVLAILLMPVNWGLESFKWRYLIRSEEDLPLLRAVKAVLTGISVSTFTPNRIGEFAGRIFILKKADLWNATFITLLGSLSQLVVTLLLGCAGLIFFSVKYLHVDLLNPYLFWTLIVVSVGAVFGILFFYFNIKVLRALAGKWIQCRWPKIANAFEVFSKFSFKELFIVLLFSFLRYLVFSCQYYFLLRFFNVNIFWVDALIFLTVIFFVMSAIPTIALSELGMRGSVSLFVLGYYFSVNAMDAGVSAAIVAASTLLWIINLALPAITGTFFVYQLKFFRNKRTI
jgi:hypothetical protein